MIAISEAVPNTTRLPYSLYIPSRLMNSLRDNNIMHKNTEHYLTKLASPTEIPFFFWGGKSKIKFLCPAL